MKSREGTVVDADDLIKEIEKMVADKFQEMREEGMTLYTPESSEEEQERIQDIAKAAYNFYLLLPTARKDMIFDKNRSIELKGKTGPYIQYTYARLSALIDDYTSSESTGDYDYISEKEVIMKLARYQDYLTMARDAFDPSTLAQYTYQLAETVNTYYHKVPVKKEENAEIRLARQEILAKTRETLGKSMYLLHLPTLEKM